jgi:hypothetical protein
VSAPSWLKPAPQSPLATDPQVGWARRRADRLADADRHDIGSGSAPETADRSTQQGTGATADPTTDRHDGLPMPKRIGSRIGSRLGADWQGDRPADRHHTADADETADADRQDGGLVVTADAESPLRAEGASIGTLRRHWADTPRAATEHLGSLHELFRYAHEAHINFGHIPIVRSASIVFFWGLTVPTLILAWPFLWAYVIKFDRALTFWFLTFLIAPPLNSLADWLVPDVLVWTDWPASVWQVIAGLALVFVIATVLVTRRRSR